MHTMVQMAGSLVSDFLIWRYDQIQTFCTNDLTIIDNGKITQTRWEGKLTQIPWMKPAWTKYARARQDARLKVAFL